MGGGPPKHYRSDTGGVLPMSITGRMAHERERLFGMTAEERAWRAQWVKDQHLSPREPVHVPEVYKELYNPLRRFYRSPLNKFHSWLLPKVGGAWADYIRWTIPTLGFSALFIYVTWYNFKYNGNTWEKHNGVRIYYSKPTVYPGEKDFPLTNWDHEPSFYLDEKRGFKKDTPNY